MGHIGGLMTQQQSKKNVMVPKQADAGIVDVQIIGLVQNTSR